MARLRPALIVHYHEISLKRGNRPLFLRQLSRNLERVTGDLGPVRVHQLPGRIVLDLEGNERSDAVAARVSRVCGVASASLASRVPSTVDAMKSAVAAVVDGSRFASFRISARARSSVSAHVGRAEPGARSFVVERTRARVDLRAPEWRSTSRCCPPRPSSTPIGSPGPAACPWARRAPSRRCCPAGSIPRWRPGG